MSGMPFPLILKIRFVGVPEGILSFVVPSRVGTSTSPPITAV